VLRQRGFVPPLRDPVKVLYEPNDGNSTRIEPHTTSSRAVSLVDSKLASEGEVIDEDGGKNSDAVARHEPNKDLQRL
jgi:hypothetical protein